MIAVLAGTVGAVLGGLLVAHRLRTRGAAPARLLGAGAGVHTAPGIQVLARPDAPSGGFWHFAALPRNRSLLLVGEATGDGVSPGLAGVTARACVATLRELRGELLEPGEIMRVMAQVLTSCGHGQLRASATAAVYDPHAKRLRVVSGGVAHLALVRPDGEIVEAAPPGPWLGTESGVQQATSLDVVRGARLVAVSRELPAAPICAAFFEGDADLDAAVARAAQFAGVVILGRFS